MGMAGLFGSVSAQTRATRASLAGQSLANSIRATLAYHSACTATFGDTGAKFKESLLGKSQTAPIKDSQGNVIFEVGANAQGYEDGVVRIVGWTLTKQGVLSVNGSVSTYLSNLNFNIQSTSDKSTYLRSIEMVTTIDASTGLTDCAALDAAGNVAGSNPMANAAVVAAVGNFTANCPANYMVQSCSGKVTTLQYLTPSGSPGGFYPIEYSAAMQIDSTNHVYGCKATPPNSYPVVCPSANCVVQANDVTAVCTPTN